MDSTEWTDLSVGAQMIKWTNEPELYGPHPEDADHEPNEITAVLYEESDYWSLGYDDCSAPTAGGSACGFPRDRHGSCGVESRHLR
ncbi:hypothetical protein FNV58_00940 (plasmid) [Streptomyces sp. RLB1-9]|uniref:hypothetical protein n=1 Tax=Streptomyces sp. RLB1-9 TaxID=2594454 RepID=UPI001165B2ED|nr:hypothetical protein [Streptomyces sp. RLB1-9]QDN94926.1 hypothetical protein FNV58_00940 [Streptomyces sp. RLB1-9]